MLRDTISHGWMVFVVALMACASSAVAVGYFTEDNPLLGWIWFGIALIWCLNAAAQAGLEFTRGELAESSRNLERRLVEMQRTWFPNDR